MARTNVVRISAFPQLAGDLSAAVDAYLASCKSRNLSACTIGYYRYRLQSFERFLAESAAPSAPKSVTPNVIRAFLTSETERNSPTTAAHSHVALSAFFGYLTSEGFLDVSPMDNVKKPRRRKTVINTFSMEQVEAVLGTCGKDFVGVRDRAVITMLVDCGLRASEIAGLELDDVNWAEGSVLVLGKGDKERVVPFGQTTRRALNAYLSRRGSLDTGYLFVSTLATQFNRFRIRDMIADRCRKTGITGVRCSPHTLRHTMAVSYLRNGADVFSLQKILGHSSLDMTRNYAELSQTDVQDKHRMFSPADRLKQPEMKTGRKRLR